MKTKQIDDLLKKSELLKYLIIYLCEMGDEPKRIKYVCDEYDKVSDMLLNKYSYDEVQQRMSKLLESDQLPLHVDDEIDFAELAGTIVTAYEPYDELFDAVFEDDDE